MSNRRLFRTLLLTALMLVSMGLTAAPARAADNFYENEGIAGLAQTLRRISSGVRILHIGAHPDDEDSALIARLSLGDGARVTYLSLTRGEGGQNLIGPEFFEELGVLRTAELLAARELDGGHQLFGRQIDFGYSKTAEETFQHWPREEVVRDIVRAIRRTRPHVVFCRFSGTSLDGHGHHQVSVLAAREAVEAAADPRRFRDLRELGLEPWRVQKFYTGRLAGGTSGALEARTDLYDPWVGRSLGAVGYAGRSMHRSQDMGMLEYEESRPAVLMRERPPADPDNPEPSLIAGLELERSRLRARAAELLLRPRALNDPMILSREIASLLEDWRREAPEEADTIRDLENALAAALGLRIEAFAETAELLPGSRTAVNCRAYVAGGAVITHPDWELRPGDGLRAEGSGGMAEDPLRASFELAVEDAAVPALPYFLRAPRDGDLYRWPPTLWAGDPFEPRAATAVFTARFERTTFSIETPIEHRYADPAWGEIREDVAVHPPVSVAFDPPTVRLANGQELVAEPISLIVQNHLDGPFDGTLSLFDSPLREDASITVDVNLEPGQVRRYPLILTDGIMGRASQKRFVAYWKNRKPMGMPAYKVTKIDYRHIRPRLLCRPVGFVIQRLDVTLPQGLKLGYVRGSGDEVGEILAELGASVTYLGPNDLSKGDLTRYDAIVTGARAYEVREDLVENNGRLLNYVRGGGTLIVQYNKYAFADLDVAPLPMNYDRPHDRVTDETAPINILRPNHPVLNFPNKLGPEDFDGWIQERGLYFWSEWDPAYVPLLSSADSGEEQKAGGMLHLKLGRGNYIYTGYAFFRQLPEGVEGATRLFANLVSLGRAPADSRR